MDLYHATTQEFNDGDIITSNTSSAFYVNATTEMDLRRPPNAPARKTALYCADSPEFACYFLLKQQVDIKDINIYKVKADDSWRAVFSLTHAIEKKINNSSDIKNQVSEYWSPSKKWNFYEYLTPSFEILNKVNSPRINNTIMYIKYDDDFHLAASIS